MWKMCVLSVYPCCMPRKSARFHVYIYRHPFGALTFPTYVHLRSHQLLISSSSAALCTQRCQVVTSTYHVEEFHFMEKTQLSSKSLVLPNFQKSCSQIPRGTGRSIFFRTSQAMPNALALCPWSSCWGRLDTLVYSQQAGGQRRAVEP